MSHKPVRIQKQSKSDVICAYASVVNFLQSRKEVGSLSDFTLLVKELAETIFLKTGVARTARKRLALERSILLKDVTDQQLLQQPEWKNYWNSIHGASGFSPAACNMVMKSIYPDIHHRTADYLLDAKNAIVALFVNDSFAHAVCIRDGYVIDSIHDIDNGNGVYLWEGAFKGYRKVRIDSAYVYPNNLFK